MQCRRNPGLQEKQEIGKDRAGRQIKEGMGGAHGPTRFIAAMKKLPSILLILFWGGLGLFAMIHSYSLGLRGITGPGPGLMPFLIGILLILTAIYLLVSSLFFKKEDRPRQEGQSQEGQGKTSLWKAGLAVISLIAYAMLMETLGFVVTTALLLIVLFKGMGTRKWSSVLLASVLTSVITYVGFTYLRLRLPMGILWF